MRTKKMLNGKRLGAIATVAAATIIASMFGGPAMASETTPPPDGVSTTDTGGRDLSAAERSNLDALLGATATDSGETSTFSASEASQLGASEGAIAEYATTFTAAGGVLLDGGPNSVQAAPLLLSSCRGQNGYTGTYWFGAQYAANSCNTATLITTLAAAAAGGGAYAAAAALTAIGLPAGAVVGVVAAILAAGAGFLAICQNASSINAIYLNSGGVTPPSCWAQ